jgi:hypothetical protein
MVKNFTIARFFVKLAHSHLYHRFSVFFTHLKVKAQTVFAVAFIVATSNSPNRAHNRKQRPLQVVSST